jgi:hypothetical protein
VSHLTVAASRQCNVACRGLGLGVRGFAGRGERRGKGNGRPWVGAMVGRRDTQEFDEYIDPAKAEPLERDDADDEELTKFDRVVREAEKVRKSQEEEYKRTKPIFMKAIGLEAESKEAEAMADGADDDEDDDDEDEAEKEYYLGKKRQSKTSGVRKTNAKGPALASIAAKAMQDIEEGEEVELEPEEEIEAELEELEEVIPEVELDEEVEEEEFGRFRDNTFGGLAFDEDGEDEEAEEDLQEPTYRMTLGELLDEARVTPISVEGDLEVEITGIQHDSRQVIPGDLFVCIKGLTSDGHDFAAQAIERGAVVVISSTEVPASDGVKAVVIVEDTNILLSALAGPFVSPQLPFHLNFASPLTCKSKSCCTLINEFRS